MQELGDLCTLTVENLGLAGKPVVSVTSDMTAIEAFRVAYEQGVSGLAVVNEIGGAILANLSISDLRYLWSRI